LSLVKAKPVIIKNNYFIGCSEERDFNGCEIRPTTLIPMKKKQAIEAWNRRVSQ